MRIGKVFIGVALFVFLVAVGGSAQETYAPKPNEECYGTWINEKTINQGHIQKTIWGPDGNKYFREVSDTVPLFENQQRIDAKWTDSEGNTWYKTFGTVTAGPYKGIKWQELDKLGQSATVWEYGFTMVAEFNPDSYPTRVDSQETLYRIFYRAK